MHKNIVLLYSGGENCHSAASQAVSLAEQYQANLYIVGINPGAEPIALATEFISLASGFGGFDGVGVQKERLKRAVASLLDELGPRRISAIPVMLDDKSVSQIINNIKNLKPDILVFGKRERNIFTSWMTVSQEEIIASSLKCSVFIVK